jgi:IPT/TIG domain
MALKPHTHAAATRRPGEGGLGKSRFDVAPSPAPVVLAFLPLSGPVGTSVAITGTGFTGATAVTFNGMPASFTVDLDTLITRRFPLVPPTARSP